MTLQIKSLAQLLVEGATLAGIDIGASTAAEKYTRAQVALAVAAGFTSLSSGDVNGAIEQVQTEILSKVTDPGQVALVNSLFNVGGVFIQAAAAANGALPLLNATWQGVAGEVATGITTIASSYPAPPATGTAGTASAGAA
jgi:hypothetical protein